MPHVIRLREPWERQRLADGSLRLMRRFHRPTGLDDKSRVWLVVENLEGAAEILLNERVLGRLEASETPGQDARSAAHHARFEITELLRPENVISIVATALPDKDAPAGISGSVRLEIDAGSE